MASCLPFCNFLYPLTSRNFAYESLLNVIIIWKLTCIIGDIRQEMEYEKPVPIPRNCKILFYASDWSLESSEWSFDSLRIRKEKRSNVYCLYVPGTGPAFWCMFLILSTVLWGGVLQMRKIKAQRGEVTHLSRPASKCRAQG